LGIEYIFIQDQAEGPQANCKISQQSHIDQITAKPLPLALLRLGSAQMSKNSCWTINAMMNSNIKFFAISYELFTLSPFSLQPSALSFELSGRRTSAFLYTSIVCSAIFSQWGVADILGFCLTIYKNYDIFNKIQANRGWREI